jgi:ABC-type ATPase involved in cell division
MAEPILSFEQAQLPILDGWRGVLSLDGSIQAADLAFIETEDERHETSLADAIFGFTTPSAGKVRFLGRDWTDLPYDYADALRGRIGWAPNDDGWVTHLSMPENICLPVLHHTRAPPETVYEQATALAVQFGLPGLPAGSLSEVDKQDAVRAAFVRAFLGFPSLIIIGYPRRVPADRVAPLINAAQGARARDAAVLWFVRGREVWDDGSIRATRRLRIQADGAVENVP